MTPMLADSRKQCFCPLQPCTLPTTWLPFGHDFPIPEGTSQKAIGPATIYRDLGKRSLSPKTPQVGKESRRSGRPPPQSSKTTRTKMR
eukprot:997453-Amphidinium_carterae.1